MKFGSYMHNNHTIDINLNNIKNPYCVYLPYVENNIKKFIFINENIIGKVVYESFIKMNYGHTPSEFLNWMAYFKNINFSNWRVLILKLEKNRTIN